MQSYNFTILLSLISLGFFGGFSHCSGMCGPFVLSQVSSRLQATTLEQFSQFSRIKNFALIPYHAGRIVTYSFIGFFCSLITKNLKEVESFNFICGILLLFAAAFFAKNLFPQKFSNFIKTKLFLTYFQSTFNWLKSFFSFLKIKNFPKFKTNFKTPAKINLLLKKLFQNPQGLNGFFLGILLGFIPCGLLYGAFALAASIANPTLAAFGMALFGLATFPALFLTAGGGYFFLKFAGKNFDFKLISIIVILINIITLTAMGLGLILN